MPPPSKIDQLPEDVRSELDALIIDNGFGGYVGLSEWLAAKGFEISKTTVGAYGQKLERRLAAVRASTEAARLIAAAAQPGASRRDGLQICGNRRQRQAAGSGSLHGGDLRRPRGGP